MAAGCPCPSVGVAKAVFAFLGCFMSAVVIYTCITDGLPFRKELLTPWMAATLIDFYINVTAIAVWVAYKEANAFIAFIWIVLLICLGSISTCFYVVLQLFRISSQEQGQNPIHYVLLRSNDRAPAEDKCPAVLIGRIVFSVLGCLMLVTLIYTIVTDGSPLRKELLTPWLTATLIDFYVNVFAISVWVAHKEESWINALCWIVLLICFGSITTCVYIVIQLSKISIKDSIDLVLIQGRNKQVRNTLSRTVL